MSNIRVRLIIQGRVQGVWFRESTRRQAEILGAFGWVRNLADGSVEALIEGPRDRVERLIAWCHKGPEAAQVTRVSRQEEPYTGRYDDFGVTHSGECD